MLNSRATAAQADPEVLHQAVAVIDSVLADLDAGRISGDTAAKTIGLKVLTAREVVLEALRATQNGGAAAKEPPPGLLMSMALRYDHGLAMPGYYDWQESIFGEPGTGTGAHARRLESTLTTMRQLWEEVADQGFYSPDKEADYAAMAQRIRAQPDPRQEPGTGGEP